MTSSPRNHAPAFHARRLWLALLALFTPVVVACDQTPTAAPAPPPPAVTVSNPLYQEITEWDEYTGRFSAIEHVELRAQVSGYLKSIDFQDGQVVKRGDLLFEIDPRPFQATLASNQAQLEQAQARLELARRELTRAAQLRQREFTPESVYDQRVQEMRVAEAAVQSAQAAIRSSELDIEFSRITSPITGRVGRHEISVGNLVTGGTNNATLLTTVVSLDPIYFDFDVSESNYVAYQRAVAEGRLKSTRDNTVQVFARPIDETSWTLAGHMNFIDNVVDRSSGTVHARAIFPNPKQLIAPGEFGRIRIPGSEPYKAILIPDSAIVTDQARKLVMTVKDDGTVEPKVIRPGPKSDELGLRIVRSGLSPDDRIIINGLVRARPGAKVTPQPGQIEPEQHTG